MRGPKAQEELARSKLAAAAQWEQVPQTLKLQALSDLLWVSPQQGLQEALASALAPFLVYAQPAGLTVLKQLTVSSSLAPSLR